MSEPYELPQQHLPNFRDKSYDKQRESYDKLTTCKILVGRSI